MKKKLLHYLILYGVLPIIWLYSKLTFLTSKKRIQGEEKVEQLTQNRTAMLFAFWHNRQSLIPLLRPQNSTYGLVSSSRDGAYMAAYLKMFGRAAIRGSSSKKGSTAMKQIIRALHAGHCIGIATDGPKGPVFKVKPGIVQLSQMLQIPIIPISLETNRKKVFSSWDQSYLFYPFSTMAIVYGAPITIEKDCALEDGCLQVEKALNQAGRDAQKLLDKQ